MTRYADALAALIDPAPEPLIRETAPTRARLAELRAEHLDMIRRHRRRYTTARTASKAVAAGAALRAIREAGRRHRARVAALRAETSSAPSLLEQLLDAVHSTSGAGNGGRGVHRSPLNPDAVELLEAIRRTTGAGALPLDVALRAWRPDDEIAGAAQLDTWVAAARALFDPPKRIQLWGRTCPACGEVDVHIGPERIRHAAIVVLIDRNRSPHADRALCVNPACGQTWERAKWPLLAAAMAVPAEAGWPA